MPTPDRRDLLRTSGIALASGLAGCIGGDDGGGEEISWTIATQAPEGADGEIVASEFADVVDEKSDGRIEIEVAPGAQYGSEPEALEQLQSGAIDMVSQSACLPEAVYIDPTYIICATFFHLDEPEWESYLQYRGEILPKLDIPQQLEEAGVKPLLPEDRPEEGHFYAGRRGLASQKPIRTPEDADGYQISVAEADIMVAPLEGIGFEAQTVPLPERLEAVQRGAVSATEGTAAETVTQGIHDLMDYWIRTDHGINAYYLMVNTGEWSSLDADNQELLMEATTEAKEEADATNMEKEETFFSDMEEAGVEIIDDFDREAIYSEAREGVREWYEANDPPITFDEAVTAAEL